MPAFTDRLLIQNALTLRARTGDFPTVQYDAETAEATRGPALVPETVLVNEVRSEFAVDARNGLSYQSKRTAWHFTLFLKFTGEVALDVFEESLREEPVKLPAISGSAGRTGITLLIVRCLAKHPPRQQSSTGTTAEITFSALMR